MNKTIHFLITISAAIAGSCYPPEAARKKRLSSYLHNKVLDGPGLEATIGRPTHLNSLSNGDIMFIDSKRCVRRIREQTVQTIFGEFCTIRYLN